MTLAAANEIKTGVKNEVSVGNALASILGDTYRLMIKTHVYHWNVVGPEFYSIHNLTEEQYQNLFAASDVLAERIRALGQMAPSDVSGVIDGSVIGETIAKAQSFDMVKDLAGDHERMAHRLRALVSLAEKQNDPVTADLATARSAFHEKAAWMLRATAS